MRKAKGNIRAAQERQKEIDKGNHEQHRAVMDMEERCRKLQGLIVMKKNAQANTLKRMSEGALVVKKRSSMGKQEEEPSEQELELAIKVTQDLVKEEEKRFKK